MKSCPTLLDARQQVLSDSPKHARYSQQCERAPRSKRAQRVVTEVIRFQGRKRQHRGNGQGYENPDQGQQTRYACFIRHQEASTGCSTRTPIAARQKAGRSSGLREVTRLRSTTTSASS